MEVRQVIQITRFAGLVGLALYFLGANNQIHWVHVTLTWLGGIIGIPALIVGMFVGMRIYGFLYFILTILLETSMFWVSLLSPSGTFLGFPKTPVIIILTITGTVIAITRIKFMDDYLKGKIPESYQ